jgi:hypothetical protein
MRAQRSKPAPPVGAKLAAMRALVDLAGGRGRARLRVGASLDVEAPSGEGGSEPGGSRRASIVRREKEREAEHEHSDSDSDGLVSAGEPLGPAATWTREYLQGLQMAKHTALTNEVLAVKTRIEETLDEFHTVINPRGPGASSGEVHIPGQGRRGMALFASAAAAVLGASASAPALTRHAAGSSSSLGGEGHASRGYGSSGEEDGASGLGPGAGAGEELVSLGSPAAGASPGRDDRPSPGGDAELARVRAEVAALLKQTVVRKAEARGALGAVSTRLQGVSDKMKEEIEARKDLRRKAALAERLQVQQ